MFKFVATLCVTSALIVFASCDRSVPLSDREPLELDSHSFENETTGWSMTIPEGWKQMAVERAEAMLERGGEAMQDAAGGQLDVSGVRQILNLQNGRFNILQATLEPYDEAVSGDWSENNELVRELISKTYTDQGIVFEMGDTRNEVIDGIEFQKYEIKLFDPEGSLLLHQHLFGALRNGHDFGVAISFQEKEPGEELMKAWRASSFSKEE